MSDTHVHLRGFDTPSRATSRFSVSEEFGQGLPSNTLIAYTDGSCTTNQGSGGWGLRLIFINSLRQGFVRDIHGGAPKQTNNTMELMAIKAALVIASQCHQPAIIYSDSKYAIGCLTKWSSSWARNDWRNSKGKPVSNKELIQTMLHLVTDNVKIAWVKGHAGHMHNEAADALANKGRAAFGGGNGQ